MYRLPVFTVFLLSLAVMPLAHADESSATPTKNSYRMHLNGFAYHFKKKQGPEDWNSNLWGVGVQGPFSRIDDNRKLFGGWNGFWEFDLYKDSYSDVAAAGGFSVQRKLFTNLDFGFRAGLVYEKFQKEDTGLAILPYILPYVETSFESPVNMRMTLLPPIPAFDVGGVLSMQFIVDLH